MSSLRRELAKQTRKTATSSEVAREARRNSGVDRDPRHTERKKARDLDAEAFPLNRDGKRRIPAGVTASGNDLLDDNSVGSDKIAGLAAGKVNGTIPWTQLGGPASEWLKDYEALRKKLVQDGFRRKN